MSSPPTLAPETASPPAAAARPVPAPPPTRLVRSLLHAMGDEGTYDLRRNPPLWMGFLLALPIPILAVAARAEPWLILAAIPAPLVWAVVLGAAGRVSILAEQERERLSREMEIRHRMAAAAQETLEEALGEETTRRTELERREEMVVGDLRLAQAVHSTLMPTNVQRSDVEVAVRQIPCQFVGGDYLHAAVVDDRWLYLCAADVSGHGVAAALVVARMHGQFRRVTLERRRPETILEGINRAALDLFRHTYFFMTLAVLRLDLESGLLEYATAGHPPQVLLRADGRFELLRTPNRLLGIDADIFDAERPSARTQLAPGDTLVLFTDGLFEILGGKEGEMLGEQGLHERIASLHGLSPGLMAGEILQELADFQGRTSFHDDVSLIVATWKGRGPTAQAPESAF